jgi:hypothetical protein
MAFLFLSTPSAAVEIPLADTFFFYFLGVQRPRHGMGEDGDHARRHPRRGGVQCHHSAQDFWRVEDSEYCRHGASTDTDADGVDLRAWRCTLFAGMG